MQRHDDSLTSPLLTQRAPSAPHTRARARDRARASSRPNQRDIITSVPSAREIDDRRVIDALWVEISERDDSELAGDF